MCVAVCMCGCLCVCVAVCGSVCVCVHSLLLLVSGRPQCQHYGVGDLQHGLQDGGHHDEEDDAEEEGPVDDLQLDQARLYGQD